MPKIQAITNEMKSIADNIGNNISAMTDSQTSVKNCMSNILVHFESNPKVLTTIHLANVTNGYRNSSESLNGYRDFLINAADTYEWNDEQLARWNGVMQEQRNVDIYSYVPPTELSNYNYDEENYQSYNSVHGTNCYSFVNQVLIDQGKSGLSGWDGGASLNGLETISGGQKILGSGQSMTADDVRSLFANAQPGDVVQMRWGYVDNDGVLHTSCHTAIISEIQDDKVQFLHSNLGDGKVKNSYYSWGELAKRYSYIGEGGGASVYRF